MELHTIRPSAVVARNKLVALTTTSATPIVTVPVGLTGLYRVGVYGIVQTAATTVTVSVTYTDPTTGSQQTLTPINGVSEPVGPFTVAVTVAAQGGTAISVTVTAGTANQVTVSAAVEALP